LKIYSKKLNINFDSQQTIIKLIYFMVIHFQI